MGGGKRSCHFLVVAVLLFYLLLPPKPKNAKTNPPQQRVERTVHNGSAAVDLVHARASLEFLESRKKAYEEAGVAQNWHLRGIAHLYEHRQVLLVGQHIVASSDTIHSIRIDNVYQHLHKTAGNKLQPFSCDQLSLWVRVRGPEIFAGKARPVAVEEDCWWSFDFHAPLAGDYKIEAKVLLWGAATSQTHAQACGSHDRQPVPADIRKRYPQRAAFRGFKLFKPDLTCSRACTQQIDPPCRYWSTPPRGPSRNRGWKGCDLYFDPGVSVDNLPFSSRYFGNLTKPVQRQLRPVSSRPDFFHGPPCQKQGYAADYFVGCGWHTVFTLDFPCLSGELDDKVYLVQETFSVAEEDGNSAAVSSTLRPLCTLNAESSESLDLPIGRWVREPWPTTSLCPLPFRQELHRTNITVNDGVNPHCWHRDNLAIAGKKCMEGECNEVPDSSKFRSDFKEERWMGCWRRYDCDYLEFTDSQLQQCIDALKISKFKKDGYSVARMTYEYLLVRLRNLTLYSGVDAGRTVTLDSLGITHMSSMSNKEFLRQLTQQHGQCSQDDFHFTLSPTFITSERAFRAHMERMKYYNAKIKERLGLVQEDDNGILKMNKGYRYLNAFDMTAAMMYEVSGQQDGLHPIGPSAKMVVTKIFHHLCKDVVNGSRL